MGRIKGLLSQKIYSGRELENRSKTNRTRAKGSPPEKAQQVKKELLTLSQGDIDVDDDNDE